MTEARITLSCENTIIPFSANAALYLGGALGYGQTALARPPQVTQFERNGVTWSGLIGYQLTTLFSIEFGYVRMQDVQASGVINGVMVADTVEPSTTYISFRTRLGLTENLSLSGGLGSAYAYGKEKLRIADTLIIRSQHKVVPFVESRLEYAFNRNTSAFSAVATSIEQGKIPRMTTASLGLKYQLG